MRKQYALLGVLALLGLALAQATYTFTINGKPATLETLEKSGKVYVEAVSFAKALGASVTFDQNKRSFVIVTSGQNAIGDVQGTTQLAGGEGALAKTYSLGKTDNALNFTLNSLEYSLVPVTMGTNVYAPKSDEKLLVLHYTVQNPQKREMGVASSAFKFTVVDDKDVNHVFNNYIAREATNEIYNTNLKPAQKVDLYAALTVPGAGQVPKLIVERKDGSPVVRFDLRGKVKPLVAPFADPADQTGASALAEIPAQPGEFYPMLNLGVKLESVDFSKDKIDGRLPAEGKRYLVATFTIKSIVGATVQPIGFNAGRFKIELRDVEGDRQTFNGYLIKVSRDEHAQGTLKSGEEYRFRAYFTLPDDLAPQSLSISERESHVYVFDLSNTK
jgi:hypothetical protein